MKKRKNRLVAIGISTLASVVFLALFRQPQPPTAAQGPTPAIQAQPVPAMAEAEAPLVELPGDAPQVRRAQPRVWTDILPRTQRVRGGHRPQPDKKPAAAQPEIPRQQRRDTIARDTQPQWRDPAAGNSTQPPRRDTIIRDTNETARAREDEREDRGEVEEMIDDQPATAPAPAVRRRSTAKSAAIILGTAAAGAAIGGLSGGGKGAAIGAATGAAGGYVYDRMTRRADAAGSGLRSPDATHLHTPLYR
jgi:hypothetical protein